MSSEVLWSLQINQNNCVGTAGCVKSSCWNREFCISPTSQHKAIDKEPSLSFTWCLVGGGGLSNLSAVLARSLRMGSVFSQLLGNKHTEALLSLLVKGILVICQPGKWGNQKYSRVHGVFCFQSLRRKAECTWEKHQLTVVSLWKQILDLWNTQWPKMVVQWKPVQFLVVSRKDPCIHSLRIPNIYVIENTCLSDPAESLIELPHEWIYSYVWKCKTYLPVLIVWKWRVIFSR